MSSHEQYCAKEKAVLDVLTLTLTCGGGQHKTVLVCNPTVSSPHLNLPPSPPLKKVGSKVRLTKMLLL